MNGRYLFRLCLVITVALAASMGVAQAQTTTTFSAANGTVTMTLTTGSGDVQASTYPIQIPVSGVTGPITKVTVSLNGINMSFFKRTGLLLVGPGGQNLNIFDNPCNGSGFPGGNYVINDAGSNALNQATPVLCTTVTAGSYQPTTRTADNFTSPGPGTSYNSAATIGSDTLTATNGQFTGLSGSNVNGTWNLYWIGADGVAGSGTMGGSSTPAAQVTITYTAGATPTTTSVIASASTFFAGSSATFTATVSPNAGSSGTVTFSDNVGSLACSGGNTQNLSGSTAACTTVLNSEGLNVVTASYNGGGSFGPSSGTANVFVQKHATNVGTTYCNTGTVTNDGHSDVAYSHTSPYPSVIFVGDGTNTDIPGSVSTLSVQLKGFTSAGTNQVRMLLVAPDGTHAYDFWSNAGAGAAGTGDYTIMDGATQLSSGSPLSPGTYGPAGYGILPDPFTPGPPSPAPQVPGSYFYAAPMGNPNSKTFFSAFTGAAAHGAWSLFLHNAAGAGSNTSFASGWCLNITPGTGHPTTVSLMANPTQATLGSSVTFTATVTSNPAVGSTGTVTFTENGGPLTGAPNGGVANVVNGVATIGTSGLPEGDHIVNGQYHDNSNTFSDNFGSVTMRVDKATSTPTLNGSTWSYCNTGAITIPAGTVVSNDFGPAAPNPSNVFVTNLPGTISSIGVTLKNFHDIHADDLETLLVGPNGGSVPTTAQTLDFFTRTGGGFSYGPADINFSDAFAPAPQSALPANNGPASYGATPSYTTSPFYTLPGTLQRATNTGSFTFNTGPYILGNSGGVYKDTIPNGTWSLYFDQLINDTGSGVNNGWCVNFIENPVTVNPTAGHVGSAPSNHFKQGEQNAQLTISIHNNGDSNGLGSTGDPDGLHPLTVVDVLPANGDYAPGTLPTGSPWNCTNVGQTVTCKSSNAIASGSNYPQLVIPVNVSPTAGASDNNSFSASGGGITATSSNTDAITIDPSPVLAVTKSHSGTFTQGSTADWKIQVTNNAVSASGSTDGTTVTVSDTLPTGYTMQGFTGTGWLCSGSNTVTCTTTAMVAGGGVNFNLITLTVNVPSSSPTSVNNTAKVYGGGDVLHTSLGTAATGSDNNVPVVQVPASISPNTNTTPQSTGVGNAFGTSLGVTVKDAGNVVIPNFTVTLSAPGSGASGTFASIVNPPCGGANCQLTTNGSGVATAPVFTANGTPGSYNVQATAGPVSTNFALTNLPQITVTTSVNGPTVQVDGGVAFTGSQTFFWVPTSTHSLATSSPQTISGTQYAFVNWSDGGAVTHNVSGPAVNTTYTATFDAVPTVTSFSVLFGSQSFTLGSIARTRLPWQITGIQVVFSKPITAGNMNSLSGVITTGFSGLGTNTLTWTISPISIGVFTATLAGSGGNALTDAAGTALSNGAGASQPFKVLWGDYNDDGVVNSQDVVLVNAQRSQPYNRFADMNGDGVVNVTDVTIVRGQVGNSQP